MRCCAASALNCVIWPASQIIGVYSQTVPASRRPKIRRRQGFHIRYRSRRRYPWPADMHALAVEDRIVSLFTRLAKPALTAGCRCAGHGVPASTGMVFAGIFRLGVCLSVGSGCYRYYITDVTHGQLFYAICPGHYSS
jgi:hypothetical protein